MALKDRFEKIVSYFDTDDISDVDTVDDELMEVTQPSPSVATRPTTAPQPVGQQPTSNGQQSRPLPSRASQEASAQSAAARPANTTRPASPRATASAQVAEGATVMTSQGQMKIVLKYPRVYEDATLIVDLLIQNECVLIDFEQMTDAQARRCLDFIDGASKVLYGSLRKVGSTMYLLAPANVQVDIDDLIPARQPQDQSYNYDMRPR